MLEHVTQMLKVVSANCSVGEGTHVWWKVMFGQKVNSKQKSMQIMTTLYHWLVNMPCQLLHSTCSIWVWFRPLTCSPQYCTLSCSLIIIKLLWAIGTLINTLILSILKLYPSKWLKNKWDVTCTWLHLFYRNGITVRWVHYAAFSCLFSLHIFSCLGLIST